MEARCEGKPLVFDAYIKAGRHWHVPPKRRRIKSYREMEADLPGLSYSHIRRLCKARYPSIFRALANGRDEDQSTAGRVGRSERPGAAFARNAQAALLQAQACLPGVTSAEDRYRLAEIAREISSALEEAGLEKPTF